MLSRITQFYLPRLGHRNQIDRINIRCVLVLSSSVNVIDSDERDLGVVIDSRLTMFDHVILRSVGLAITSFVSCDRWLEHSLKQLPRR